MATAPAPLATLPAPDSVARQRKLYEAMLGRGIDYSPVQHWTQGAARLANALVGRMGIDDAASQERKARAETSRQADAAINALMGGGAAPGAPAAAPAAATPAMAPAAPAEGRIATPGIENIVRAAAERYGINPDTAVKVALIESTGDPTAVNARTNAAGLFQAMPATAKQYGLTDPKDPAASADFFGRLWQNNRGQLTKRLGRVPTDGEMYLAHQQGAGGAGALLSNPDANVVDALAGAYGGNRARAQQAVVQNGGRPDMTAGQFAQQWTSRFGAGAAPVAGPGGAVSAQSRAPAGGGMGAGAAQAGGLPNISGLASLLNNPWATDAQRQVVGALLQQRMKAFGPRDPIALGENQRLVDLRSGQVLVPGTGGRPTYGVIGEDQFGRKQYGWIDPSRQQVAPGGPAAAPASAPSQTQATADGARGVPPPSFEIPPPPEGADPKKWREEWTKTAQKDAAQRTGAAQRRTESVLGPAVQDANRIIEEFFPNIAEGDGIIGANLRAVRSRIPGTGEYNFLQQIEALRTNISVRALDEMRASSPSGGALGAVPVAQQQMMANILGSFDIKMPPHILKQNLHRLVNIYQDAIHGTPAEIRQAVKSGRISSEQAAPLLRRYELPFDAAGRRIEKPVLPDGAVPFDAPKGDGKGPAAAGQPRPGAPGGPAKEAVDYLRANPNLREEFDRKYGPGAAAKVLGQ